VLDQFVIWEGGISERHKQSTEQNTKTKNMNLTSNKTQPRWAQTQQSNWNKICGSKGYRTAEDMNFFGFFGGSRYENMKQTKRHMSIPHGKPKIWYHLIVEWVPIFREVRGKSIGGDLDVDDEGSKQHRFEAVQSLHHGSVGYQLVHTRIGLAKKAMSLQANWERKQGHEIRISNCRWMISSQKLGSYKLNVGETVLDRLI
jgi:hypothetical protein